MDDKNNITKFGGLLLDSIDKQQLTTPEDFIDERSSVEEEYSEFKNSFDIWYSKLSRCNELSINYSQDNFIIYKKGLLPKKKVNKTNIEIDLRVIVDSNLFTLTPSARTLRGYIVRDRETGLTLNDNQIYSMLVASGYLEPLKNSNSNNKKRRIRVITKGLDKEGKLTFKDNSFSNIDVEDLAKYSDIVNNRKSLFCSLALVKITSCEESIRLFGYKNIKLEMLNTKELYNVVDIIPAFKCKLDSKVRNVVVIKSNQGKAYKFLMSEIEVFLPDYKKLLKSITTPKIREFKKGSSALVINSKRTSLALRAKVKVLGVEKVGGKEYASIVFEDKTHVINRKQLRVI